ncbi:MAG: hypothetical protein HC936_03690 [Leptolyngbyaceae cyanobacterium SU_3_3]|nr:hypothetical protein [Leptolyngbyaceae cyanobacterium SU_3_3]
MTSQTRDHITFSQGDNQFDLWRLGDQEFQQLRQHSLPIQEDSGFMLQMAVSEHYNPDRLSLPQAFLTLEELFGETSSWFDEWKGSFSFPLLLVLTKNQRQFFYLLRILDHRGSLCFPLYRVLEQGAEDYDINVYRSPFELEFSGEEINKFTCYLYGYLRGASEWASKLPFSSFLKQVDSNLILYGGRDGELFEEHFESDTAYRQAIEEFKQTYDTEVKTRESEEIQSLLRRVMGAV